MTLQDIIDAGKKEKQILGIAERFDKDNSINASQEVTDVNEDRDNREKAGHGQSGVYFQNMAPAFHRFTLDQANARAQSNLIKTVQNDYRVAVESLGNGDEGISTITGIVSATKPEEAYKGVNPQVYPNHERTYHAIQQLQNPGEAFAASLKDIKDETVKEALARLGQINPEYTEVVAHDRAARAQADLRESLDDISTARDYLGGIYFVANDNARKEMAYRVGRGVTEAQG